MFSTCYVGYKFNAELHKQSASLEDQTEETKACQDVDECADNNGDCQQVHLNLKQLNFEEIFKNYFT
jgi:hypothetical protein